MAIQNIGDPISETSLGGRSWNYGTEYAWRVDSINEFGTTTGDEWSFTVQSLVPPPAYTGGTGVAKQYLVAAARMSLWISEG